MEAIQTIPILSPEALWKKGVLKGLEYSEIRPLARVIKKEKEEDPLEAHRRLVELVSQIVESPEWKGSRENATEEFIRWRNRFDVFNE